MNKNKKTKSFGVLYQAKKMRYFEDGAYCTAIIVRRYITRTKKTSKYVSQHLKLYKNSACWEQYSNKYNVADGLALEPLSLDNKDLIMATSLDSFIVRLMESTNKMMVEIGEILMESTLNVMDEVSTESESLPPEIFTIPGSKLEGHKLFEIWEKHNGYQS